MSLLVDIQYARQLQHKLLLPDIKSTRPFKLNARCPVCGDSKKKKHLCRFWINEVKGRSGSRLRVGCWNCDLNMTLFEYLKEYEPAMFAQYRVDVFKENNNRTEPRASQPEPEPEQEEKEIVRFKEESLFWNATDLDENHPVSLYLKKRRIPKDKLHLLGFTRTWNALAKTLRPDLYTGEIRDEHPRLIIPIYDDNGLIAIQGRALSNRHTQRYMTIKIDPEFNKIYGTERIDPTKEVIYVEGPIDSLFLDNCCAIVGGTVSPKNAPYMGNRVWALDNEPRHPDVVHRMEALIRAGERVVIWDRLIPKIANKKDINNFVECGVSPEYIQQYIHENAVGGLVATNRLNRWKKI